MNLSWLLSFPWSTISVFIVSLILSVAISVLNSVFVNFEEVRRWSMEVKRWQEEYRKASARGDRKALAKLKKREPQIRRMSSRLLMRYMEMMALSIAVIIIPFYMLRGFYGGAIVAVFPIGNIRLNFVWWYILCSAAFGTIASRALRGW